MSGYRVSVKIDGLDHFRSLTKLNPCRTAQGESKNDHRASGTDLDYAEYQEYGTGIYAINNDGSNAGRSKYLGKIPGVGWRWIKVVQPRRYMFKAKTEGRPLFEHYMAAARDRIVKRLAGK